MVLNRDLTQGSIPKGLLAFALPLILGNLLQQLYNLADTWVVGQFLGEGALAAVGSSYTLMTFLTSILLGLCMGSSVFFAMQFGRKDPARFRAGIFQSFCLIGGLTVVLTALVYLALGGILWFLRIPADVWDLTRTYLVWVFAGIPATFLYNYFTNLLRAIGNSVTPLLFLGVSVVGNIGLDLLFVIPLKMGVMGAALLVQGLVSSFGSVVMAAFAVAVKIDTLAYMPVQDFGNAYSTFVAQNYGAGQRGRIKAGTKWALFWVLVFCLAIGGLVCCFAPQLLAIFVGHDAQEVISVGTGYLRIEGSCYLGIGILFLLYGYFRAVDRPAVSLVLTVCSLGTRVALAYLLSAYPAIGVTGIWAAIPIGWFFADTVGGILWRKDSKRSHP